MNNYKITVLFVIQRNKMNKKGLCPIRCRITYQKKRKVFSSGLFIKPENWDITTISSYSDAELLVYFSRFKTDSTAHKK
tara:strand:+ start:142 stop:378 length:237 start_codon:yes stop_codon:yes gene_type:complete